MIRERGLASLLRLGIWGKGYSVIQIPLKLSVERPTPRFEQSVLHFSGRVRLTWLLLGDDLSSHQLRREIHQLWVVWHKNQVTAQRWLTKCKAAALYYTFFLSTCTITFLPSLTHLWVNSASWFDFLDKYVFEISFKEEKPPWRSAPNQQSSFLRLGSMPSYCLVYYWLLLFAFETGFDV